MYSILKTWLKVQGQPISKDLWEEINEHSELISVKKNDVLINYGSRHKHAYFIASGSFVTSTISEDGDKKSVWFHFDELFNIAVCTDSYFLNEFTKYEIKALEDSKVIKFNKHHVDLWALKYPLFNQHYHSNIIFDFVSLHEIRAYRLSHSPTKFLDYLNKKYPTFNKRVSSKNMAHFIGVSPEWYSKLKKKMSS